MIMTTKERSVTIFPVPFESSINPHSTFTVSSRKSAKIQMLWVDMLRCVL